MTLGLAVTPTGAGVGMELLKGGKGAGDGGEFEIGWLRRASEEVEDRRKQAKKLRSATVTVTGDSYFRDGTETILLLNTKQQSS